MSRPVLIVVLSLAASCAIASTDRVVESAEPAQSNEDATFHIADDADTDGDPPPTDSREAQAMNVHIQGTRPQIVSYSENDPAEEELANDRAQEVSYMQPARAIPIEPRIEPTVVPGAGAAEVVARFYAPGDLPLSLTGDPRRAHAPGLAIRVPGYESLYRQTKDAGSLLDKASGATGLAIEKRTPIVNDPHSRGLKQGQLNANGSYWVPARQDLDTMISKIDSALLSDVVVIRGPYSARHGPGLAFISFDLLDSPRYAESFGSEAVTALNYETNGKGWSGRQTIAAGSTDWGVRASYGHRTANDYVTGDGLGMPSSYNWRDFDIALGRDLSCDEHLEFNYLRVDQTGVEFPGQAYDMDFLVVDGFEATYVLENQCEFDRLRADSWYNNTRFAGNSQRTGKRRQFPILDEFEFFGLTDAEQMSAGGILEVTWGAVDCPQVTLGTDLRFVQQVVNEFNHFRARRPGGNPITDPPLVAFPLYYPDIEKMVPKSHVVNPGLFAEAILPLSDRLTVKGGQRFDWAHSEVVDPRDVTRYYPHPMFVVQDWKFPGMPELVIPVAPDGTVDLDQDLRSRDFALGSLFLTSEFHVTQHWSVTGGAGFAMRAPTATELYSFNGPFLALLQRGGNFVNGDPNLRPERLWQVDLGTNVDYGRLRGGVTVFHARIEDYITFRPVVPGAVIPEGRDAVLPVQFTNTDLATLTGGEVFASCDCTDWLTAFAKATYVQGKDRSRDRSGLATYPTVFVVYPVVASVPVPAPKEEALPGIPPLESRFGVQVHQPGERPRWGLELSARVVDEQDRIAATLREQRTPGFTTLDLRSYCRPADNLSLIAGVENLTDKQYQEHLDIRRVFQPGISFYFGSEVRY